jgi:hypothetical protein
VFSNPRGTTYRYNRNKEKTKVRPQKIGRGNIDVITFVKITTTIKKGLSVFHHEYKEVYPDYWFVVVV